MSDPFRKSLSVTQQDIARSLNLSRSTVAQALNPKLQWKLQAETVELVQKRAKEMNYHPKRFAQMLREGRAYTIGAVFKLARYYAPHEQIRLLSQTALRKGYHLVIIDRNWFEGDPEAEEKFVYESALDGLMFCNLKADHPPTWIKVLEERGVPMINIGSDIPNAMDYANWDIRKAYLELTRHHLDQGSRNVALLLAASKRECRPDAAVIYRRIEGFTQAIRERGGTVKADFSLPEDGLKRGAAEAIAPEGRIICCPQDLNYDGNAFEYGFRMVARIAAEGRFPESLVCANDDMASGAITACCEGGIRVPEEIKISGADDAPFSAYSGIPITTVSTPPEEIAKWAVSRLIDRIEGRITREDISICHFPGRIVKRRSTVGGPLHYLLRR